MKQILKQILSTLISGLILILIWTTLPVITSAKVLGMYYNPSEKTGRTHYILFRPFSEKFISWFDFSVPVRLEGSIKEIEAKENIGK